MPSNMGTGDPQPLGSVEWISYRFSELNMDDLFWFEQNLNSEQNPAFRKVSDTEALDLKSRNVIPVNSTLRVHQKEY